jgi:alkylated DNA repair dioxygenase AlkB
MTLRELSPEVIRKAETIEIPGLAYIPHYLNSDEQNKLLNIIDQQLWSLESAESTRRIQQHGYRLDYEQGFLVASTYMGALPDWAGSIAERLYGDSLIATVPDQVTVNEYLPGQGVSSHTDCVTCFGSTIITLSLGSSCVMEFTHSQTKEKAEILLSPGSLLVSQGAARYVWQHSIAARKTDKYKGKEFVRTRRVSLTFREALFPHK